MPEPRAGERWNHNIHYHSRVLRAVPRGAERALDVGCGEGMLARELRRLVPHVTGLDPDEPSIEQARRQPGDVEYVVGDVLTHPFAPGSFDVVACVATLHHMDAAAGLRRMRELLRPGGVLVVIGCARSSLPRDLPRELAAVAGNAVLRAGKSYWEHPSPVLWPPPVTYGQMRQLAAELLPGSVYRRHLLWRYSITWRA